MINYKVQIIIKFIILFQFLRRIFLQKEDFRMKKNNIVNLQKKNSLMNLENKFIVKDDSLKQLQDKQQPNQQNYERVQTIQQIYERVQTIQNAKAYKEFIKTQIKQLDMEIGQTQYEELVKQTMKNCQTLINKQNWQINPNGPLNKQIKQIGLFDRQPLAPQSTLARPKLNFKKHKSKFQKNKQTIQTQYIRQQLQKRNKYRNRIWSNRSNIEDKMISNRNNKNSLRLFTQNLFAILNLQKHNKLVPLKIETDRLESYSSRRNVQSFLRQRKCNNINIIKQVKNRGIIQQMQHETQKTIQANKKNTQPSKRSMNKKTTLPTLNKILPPLNRQECAYDFDGEDLLINKKKFINKQNANIVKSTFQIKDSVVQNSFIQKKLTKKKNKIKRHQGILPFNISMLTYSQSNENQTKRAIQKNLLCYHPAIFRQLTQHNNIVRYQQSHLQNRLKSPNLNNDALNGIKLILKKQKQNMNIKRKNTLQIETFKDQILQARRSNQILQARRNKKESALI